MNKILLIEDDPIVANVYRNKLRAAGYQVETAANGESGIKLVRNFQPQLIILDLILPDISGVEVMQTLRNEPTFAKLPIIVFSNTYLSNVLKDAWKAGASKCFSKANCTPHQIIEAIRSLLDTPAAKQAAAATISSTPAAPPPAVPDLLDQFRNQFPGQHNTLRTHYQNLIKTNDPQTRIQDLRVLANNIHTLTGNASVAGLVSLARMAEALEALTHELHQKPETLTPSTLRTIANTIDFLDYIFKRGKAADSLRARPARILVVDDELLSRRGVTHALEKARLQCEEQDNPVSALKLLTDHGYDLVILDAEMPEMNGFELCAKLRSIPTHKKTPVVFVTSHNDFEARANSTMAGANDFIAKPFLFIELAVKALTYVLRGRLENIKPVL